MMGQKQVLVFLTVSLFLSSAPSRLVWAEGSMKLENRIAITKKSYFTRGRTALSKDFNLEKMAVLDKKRRNLILDIRKFLRDARDKEQVFELSMRLGGLYMEDYYAKLNKAQVLYDRANKAYLEEKKHKGKPPQLDTSVAMASLDLTIALYNDLLKRYPESSRRDEILYFLAAASMDKGKVNDAMKYFAELTQKFPNSPHTQDALVELGDYFFNDNQFAKSEPYYDQIIERKVKALWSYAKYKKAWCAYNLGRKEEALSLFQWVIVNENKIEPKAGERDVVRVKLEAVRDIALPYVDLKILQPSVDFLKAHGGPEYRNTIESMGNLYFEGGDYDHSIFMRSVLLKIDRNHPKNPEYEIGIAEAYRLMGKENQAVNYLFSVLPGYLKRSNWYELNASQPDVVQGAYNLFEDTARKYAFQFHSEAQKTKSAELYDISKKLYAKYIEFFPDSPHTPTIRFYMAEILYKEKFYVQAAEHYYLVFQHPQAGNLKLDSIRFALAALYEQLNIDRKKSGLAEISGKSKSKIASEGELQLIPYTMVESRFLQIGSVYLKTYPTNPDSPDVSYEAAYLRYVHHDFVKAYKSFWVFIKNFPSHNNAVNAGYLVLDVLNRKQKYGILVSACKNFLSNPNLKKDTTFVAEVSKILRAGELQVIAGYEKNNEFKRAAEAYIEYTKEYGPQDETLYEKALFNASVNFTKAELFVKAVDAQEKFLRRFKTSQYREDMLLNVAKTYEIFANFGKAAEYFEQFATQYPQNPQAKNALRLSGLYYWGSGRRPKAEEVLLGYLNRSTQDADRERVKKDLIDMYETEGLTTKLIAFYQQEKNQKGVSLADSFALSVRLAEIKEQAGHRDTNAFVTQLAQQAKANARELSRTAVGKEALAKLLLWETRKREEQFYNLRLVLPEERMAANLQAKIALINELERDLTQIASLGVGEWSLGGIYKTAALYRHLAQSVLQAPVPSNLNAEQLENYRLEIKKTYIDPFNEKALKLAEQCVDKSQELQILSSFSPHCYALAGTLEPRRYPVVRTFYLPPMSTAIYVPNSDRLKTGPIESYNLPLYTSALFDTREVSRQLASQTGLWEAQATGHLSDLPAIVPAPMNYALLNSKRMNTLQAAMKNVTPAPKSPPTFAYLNLARLLEPKKSLPLILSTLENYPQDTALHHLLALTYLEMGDLGAAKVTLLSLIARGEKRAGIFNTMGVISLRLNRPFQAIELFQSAINAAEQNPNADSFDKQGAQAAARNLGFMSLKYYGGFQAKKYFEKAIALGPEDPSSETGLLEAKLQNREFEEAGKEFQILAKKLRSNPYTRIAFAYYVMDVQKEPRFAEKVLQEYVQSYGADKDFYFRRALTEVRSAPGDLSGLPSIE